MIHSSEELTKACPICTPKPEEPYGHRCRNCGVPRRPEPQDPRTPHGIWYQSGGGWFCQRCRVLISFSEQEYLRQFAMLEMGIRLEYTICSCGKGKDVQ
jgi:hypothetical protein